MKYTTETMSSTMLVSAYRKLLDLPLPKVHSHTHTETYIGTYTLNTILHDFSVQPASSFLGLLISYLF